MTRLTSNRLIALVSSLLCVMLTVPPIAQAAVPQVPFVYTATYVGATAYAATFAGSVNPHGSPTVYAFQYGTTTGYGAQTTPTAVGNGNTGIKVTQTIQGLQPGTTYHVRLIATNSVGTYNGQDVAFTTNKVPLRVKITSTPNPVVFGNSFSVSGVLTGTEAANHGVVLQANPFPYLGTFQEWSHPVTTGASGSFSFTIANLVKNTQLRVMGIGTPFSNMPTISEQVAVRVSLHLRRAKRRGFALMYGTVEPSEVGASVSFQLLRHGGPPRSVGWTKVGRLSTSVSDFSREARLRGSGTYRAEVHVFNGQQVSGYSRALRIG